MNTSSRVHIKLTVDGCDVEGAVDLPEATTPPPPRRLLLPVLQQLTDVVVTIAENRVGETGGTISCAKGCDACCRQTVPISATEAHFLAQHVEALPAEEGARVRARFAETEAALESAGLLRRIRERGKLASEALAQLDRDYFAARLSCPFLEGHACSIHPFRPLACREFLVTSDPVHCNDPGSGQVAQVELGMKISRALLASEGWLPLAFALTYAAETVEERASLAPAEDLIQLLGSLREDSGAGSE